jgi:hypothetical protein
MYTLNMPVSTIRTKMRQEFERHRYVTKLKTVDVLIYNSHAEFQVRILRRLHIYSSREKEVLTYDTFHRRLSTSGSSSHTCSSTSAPKKTPRKTFIAGFLQVCEYSVLFDCWGVYPASFLLHTPC